METVLNVAVLVIEAAVGVFAAAAFARARRDQRAAEKSLPRPSLEDRLTNLGDLMRSSARVLEEVQAEIQARIVLAEKAKRDAADAEQVAQLNEAQRLAIARLVRAELASEVSRESRRSFWQGFVLNFSFFLLGGLVSVATTLLLGK